MSACDKEQLLLLASDELAPRQAAQVERHVAECPACAAELERLRQGLAALDRLTPMEPSGQAVERTAADGRRAVERRRTLRPSFVHRYRYALAAAAVVAVAVGWTLIGRLAAPTDAQLDQLWREPVSDIIDTDSIVEDLAEGQAANPWTQAADVVIAQLSESDLDDELLELEESLELLEQWSSGS